MLNALVAEGSSRSDVWWNLGLVHKFQRRWEPAAAAFRRYTELRPDASEGYWNYALAATALRDWGSARWAWRRLDLDVGDGEGPPDADFGLAPVRLNPDSREAGSGEVVWGRRVDPCRVRIASVPLPESGHRWGDVVLHDVAPRGQRKVGENIYGVFDEIERMVPSPIATYRAELRWLVPEDETALSTLLDARDLGGENWTSSIQMLCAQCSLADAHEHRPDPDAPVLLAGTWGFAGPPDELAATLGEWAGAGSGRSAAGLEPAGVPGEAEPRSPD